MQEMGEQGSARGARRRFIFGAGAAAALAAGGAAPARARSASQIDQAAADALADLFREQPATKALASRAFGVLVIPDVVKAGFLIGGAYGEGVMVISGRSDSYWSYTAGSIGLQAGAQRTRLALFFLDQASLDQFLRGDQVEMGVDAEVTVIDGGGTARLDTTRDRGGIVAYVFGHAGLLGGASYSGGQYERLVR